MPLVSVDNITGDAIRISIRETVIAVVTATSATTTISNYNV